MNTSRISVTSFDVIIVLHVKRRKRPFEILFERPEDPDWDDKNCISNHHQMWFESDFKKIWFHVGGFSIQAFTNPSGYATNQIFAGSLNIVKIFPMSNGVTVQFSYSKFSPDICMASQQSANESQLGASGLTPLQMAQDSRKHHPTVVYIVCPPSHSFWLYTRTHSLN